MSEAARVLPQEIPIQPAGIGLETQQSASMVVDTPKSPTRRKRSSPDSTLTNTLVPSPKKQRTKVSTVETQPKAQPGFMYQGTFIPYAALDRNAAEVVKPTPKDKVSLFKEKEWATKHFTEHVKKFDQRTARLLYSLPYAHSIRQRMAKYGSERYSQLSMAVHSMRQQRSIISGTYDAHSYTRPAYNTQ